MLMGRGGVRGRREILRLAGLAQDEHLRRMLSQMLKVQRGRAAGSWDELGTESVGAGKRTNGRWEE